MRSLFSGLSKATNAFEKILVWVSFIALLSTWLIYFVSLSAKIDLSKFPFLNLIATHRHDTLGIILILFIAYFIYKSNSKLLFKDRFIWNITSKWDMHTVWEVKGKGFQRYINVTNSEYGGITKHGSSWSNYIMEFEACIIKDCLGIILRAKNLKEYHMIQIRNDKIRPHRRKVYNEITPPSASDNRYQIKEIEAWSNPSDQERSHNKNVIQTWFKIKIVANGHSIDIHIDEDCVYTSKDFLLDATGKIGFRCAGDESAFVRNVKVKRLP